MSTTQEYIAQAVHEHGLVFLLGRLSPEERARRTDRARWRAILRAHSSPDERAEWRTPPFAPPDGVPAWACAHAVRVLWRASRESGPDAWRGGWDSCGHWGADSASVARAWHISRGRARVLGVVLAWELRHPECAAPLELRRLSAPQLRAALRVSAWCDAFYLDARAKSALGEIEAALRPLALQGAMDRARAEAASRPDALRLARAIAALAAAGDDERAQDAQRPVPIRRRHLDWEAVAAAQRAIRGVAPEHRAAVTAAHARSNWARRQSGASLRPPAWQGVDLRDEVSEALWRGVRPADLAQGLTSREAHAWLRDGCAGKHRPCEPAAWLCARAGLPHRPRAVEVARWVIAVEQDPARRASLYREREVRGPDGALRAFQFVTRVDEIAPEDLPQNIKTSVDRAFERAAQRVGEAQLAEWAESSEILAPIPRWWKPIRCARVLRTPEALVRQGREQGHCVGTYVHHVRSHASVIIALDVIGHRSTLEVSADGRTVRQHKGEGNSDPPALCQRAWEVIASRCGIA